MLAAPHGHNPPDQSLGLNAVTRMLTSADSERLRLFVTIEAEVRITRPEDDSLVQESVFAYLSEKVPGIPRTILDVDTYDHDSGLLSTEFLRTSSVQIWSARLNEPDSNMPGRFWSLELTLGANEPRKFFGSRLSVFSRHLDFYAEPAVPRVYRELVSQHVLYGDGIRLSRTPIDIISDDDVEWLSALINNPRRQRDIIALSADADGFCTINPNIFADRLCGVSHVVRVYPDASFKLSDAIGKYLSIFDLGIRIYRPTSQIEADDPLRHTLYTKRALTRMDRERVQHAILSGAFATSLEGALSARAIPTFAQIRSARATLRLAELQATIGSKDVDFLQTELNVSQTARMAAETQAREALDIAIQEEGARKDAEDERNQERARAMVLAARVRSLESRIGPITDANVSRPKEYNEIASWVEVQFAGRLKLHRRALRGLKSAVFDDIDLVCDLLQLLGVEYVDSKRGDRGAWKRFEDGIKGHGVDHSRSISDSRAGEQGDEYFVQYRGRREFLEWHLKKGTSRDAGRDLRIYFFWDEEDEEVVIGFLPGHLALLWQIYCVDLSFGIPSARFA
jgi:hypothetical protein